MDKQKKDKNKDVGENAEGNGRSPPVSSGRSRENGAAVVVELLIAATSDIRREFVEVIAAHLGADQGRVSALARLMQVYCVRRSKLPASGEGRMREDGGSWKQVHREIEAFLAALKPMEGIPKLSGNSSADTFRNFVLGVSKNPHSGFEMFSLLALFLIDVDQKHPELMKTARVAKEDTLLMADLRRQCHWLASKPKPGGSPLSELTTARPAMSKNADAATENDPDVEMMRQYVAKFFSFRADRQQCLRGFFESAAVGDRHHAHFIVYRPQLSRPTHLVKSFLAMIPPGQGKFENKMNRNYTFAHFYVADSEGAERRRSVGVVMPMVTALYVLGGQQTQIPGQTDVEDFRALKVMALPWLPIERARAIIPGVVMSANNSDHVIVSRVAVRRTLLQHDHEVGIGLVSPRELGADLERIAGLESAQLAKGAKTFPVSKSFSTQAAQILKIINNAPPIDADGFNRVGASGPLGRTAVADYVKAVLQESGNVERYVDSTDKKLGWEDLRFGPLEPIV